MPMICLASFAVFSFVVAAIVVRRVLWHLDVSDDRIVSRQCRIGVSLRLAGSLSLGMIHRPPFLLEKWFYLG